MTAWVGPWRVISGAFEGEKKPPAMGGAPARWRCHGAQPGRVHECEVTPLGRATRNRRRRARGDACPGVWLWTLTSEPSVPCARVTAARAPATRAVPRPTRAAGARHAAQRAALRGAAQPGAAAALRGAPGGARGLHRRGYRRAGAGAPGGARDLPGVQEARGAVGHREPLQRLHRLPSHRLPHPLTA